MTLTSKTRSCPGSSTLSRQGFCLCGQTIVYVEEDAPIYCSAACARSDAMTALLGGKEHSIDMEEEESKRSSSGIHRKARILSEASERLSEAHPYLDFNVLDGDQPRLSVRLSAHGVSHYRRMLALQIQNKQKAAAAARQRGRSAASNVGAFASARLAREEQGSQSSRTSYYTSEEEDVISFVIDDSEEETEERELQSRLENPLYETLDTYRFDQEYRLRLEMAEAALRNSYSSIDDNQSFLHLCSTPNLDCYEDPVGWEGGGRIQSSNFLGLFQMHSLSTEAVCLDENEKHNKEEVGRVKVEEASNTSDKVLEEQPMGLQRTKPAILSLPPDNYKRQREYLKDAASCASSLLPPTPTTPTGTLRRLISSPSKSCSALFQRKPSKKSLRNGISNQDGPLLNSIGLSLNQDDKLNEEVEQLVTRLDAIITSKWNPLSRKQNSSRPIQRNRAYSSDQISAGEHPVLSLTQGGGRHYRYNDSG